MLGLSQTAAAQGYIVVVNSNFDVGAPNCPPGIACITAPVGSPGRAYIAVTAIDGITGAEFRITG